MTEKRFFETTAGIKIGIQPISHLDLQLAQNAVRAEFEERGEPIDPPTYEVPLLGGEVEHHPYTEKSIEDAGEEDKAAWEAHIVATGRLETAIQKRTGLVFLEGMTFEMPKGDAWIKRRKRMFGEDVPEDEEERWLYYVNNVLLKTPADKEGLTWSIYQLSLTGASKEAIQAMEELFRGEMDAARRPGLEALKALTEEKTEDLVLQPAATGSAGGESKGNDKPRAKEAPRRGSGRGARGRKRAK